MRTSRGTGPAPLDGVTIRWRITAHLTVCLLALAAAPAEAQLGQALGDPAPPAPAADAWTLDVAATTSLPLSIGVEATLTAPFGGFAYAQLGHTPQAYMSVMADALAGADAYRPRARPLIDEVIAGGAWNVRLGVGYTIPEGLEVSAGYTVLTTSADLTPGAIESATRQSFRWPGMTVVPLGLTLHALHARVGWRFVVEEHLVLRAAAGWAHTFAADARLTVPDEVRALPSDPAGGFEEDLRAGFTEKGFTAELILSAGYRF